MKQQCRIEEPRRKQTLHTNDLDGSFLRRRIGDEALAEDLLQHSFVRAVEHQHALRNDDSVVAWFYRVLRNTVIDYYRLHGAESRRDEAF